MHESLTMKTFQLQNESAYVVPAMRQSLKTNELKTLSVLSILVLLVHIAVVFVLVRMLSKTADMAVASIEETQVELLSTSSSPEPQSEVVEMPKAALTLPLKVKSEVREVSNPVPRQPQLSQSLISDKQSPSPVKPASNQSESAGSSSAPAAQPTMSGNPSQANHASGAAASAASAQTCSALTAFNRRYPGVLKQNSTVSLRISRNAQGAVTAASIIQSSGNVALDQFALNSARQARFKRHEGCDSRSFVLPILFQSKN